MWLKKNDDYRLQYLNDLFDINLIFSYVPDSSICLGATLPLNTVFLMIGK